MIIYTVTLFKGNYGSVLQAFALQSRLKEFGATPYILTECKPKRKFSKFSSLWRILRPEKNYNLFQRIQRYLQREDFKEKHSKLQQFISKNISVKTLTDRRAFIRTLSPQDVFLAGSDQVWNVLNSPLSKWYSLQWVDDKYKKYSYAASIGVSSLTKKHQQDFAKVLTGFQKISLREEQAVKSFSSIFFDKVRQDIDPTLLYEASFWRKIESPKQMEEPYVFVYMLRPDKRLIEIAKAVAKEKKCKIIFTGKYSYNFEGVQTICDAGVEDFLSYIHHAEVVVTNSFHGTAFSVLFEKPFLSVKIASTGSRAESLLKLLHLERQLIDSYSHEYTFEINYSIVKKILNKEREKSCNYLKIICKSSL